MQTVRIYEANNVSTIQIWINEFIKQKHMRLVSTNMVAATLHWYVVLCVFEPEE